MMQNTDAKDRQSRMQGIARLLTGPARHMLGATKYSLKGLRTCFRDEIAFRQECWLGVLHYALIIVLPLSWPLRLYLASIWPLLMAFELMNTAVEAITDLASPDLHELAGKAKDCASAAVFCALMLLLSSWIVVGLVIYLG